METRNVVIFILLVFLFHKQLYISEQLPQVLDSMFSVQT